MSDATAAIRRAIHDGASRDEFIRIARAFDRLTAEETVQMSAFAVKHVEAWPAEVRIAPGEWWLRIARGEDVPGFRFARGVEIDSQAIHAASAVGADLIETIAGSAAARQLLHLGVRGVAIGDDGLAPLAHTDRLVQLTSLALVDASLGPKGARTIVQANLPSLSRLDLSGNALTPEAAERLLERGGALALARCELGAEGARTLASSKRSERLTALDLGQNEVGDAGAGALSASGWLANLASLSLPDNGITERGARALASAAWLGRLSALDLSDNPIEGPLPRLALDSIAELAIARVSIEAQALLAIAPQLVALDASGNRFAPDVLAQLKSIRRVTLRDADLDPAAIGALASPERESLDLAGNPLTLAALAVLTNGAMEELDLSSCALGDAGLAMLARSRTMATLRSLSVRQDGITPEGLRALLAAEQPNLAAIDLSDNPIGPEGARLLAESVLIARLTRIHARNCGFTSEWIETLRASAPHATVLG